MNAPTDDHSKPWETVRRGLLMLISSPAGAGKTSLSRRLVGDHQDLMLSISATTRAPRPGEEEAREYFFKTRDQFKAMIAAGELLEWAEVNGQLYGTPKAPVEQALRSGTDVLFDIDWQGAQQLYQQAGGDVVRVFILPPSVEELERRLRSRGTDDAAVVEARMARAGAEISHWDGYDYVLINDNVERCFAQVRLILRAERLKRSRQVGLIGFARTLMAPRAG